MPSCGPSRSSGTDTRLVLGVVRDELAATGVGTLRLTQGLAAGDWCSLRWDWVCDRLEPAQVRALRHYTATQLAAVKHAPATVLAGHAGTRSLRRHLYAIGGTARGSSVDVNRSGGYTLLL
jgi:hypothetical protein